MTSKREVFISVDVETSGPIPGEYSLLMIGACLVDDPGVNFTSKLKPVGDKADPKALAVAGLSLTELAVTGEEPAAAMTRFRDWTDTVCGADGLPVFVGFNAAFDWSFVNYYFHRFVRMNPFGFAALDIKSYYGSGGIRVARHQVKPHGKGSQTDEPGRSRRSARCNLPSRTVSFVAQDCKVSRSSGTRR